MPNVASDPEMAKKVEERIARFGKIDEDEENKSRRRFKKFRKFNKNKGDKDKKDNFLGKRKRSKSNKGGGFKRFKGKKDD